jgi:hypothetical protein
VTELFIGEVDPSERGAIHAGKDVMRGPKFEPNETLPYSCDIYDITPYDGCKRLPLTVRPPARHRYLGPTSLFLATCLSRMDKPPYIPVWISLHWPHAPQDLGA